MKLNLIFMGTPQFSVPVLEALIKAGHTIAVVYSQPPKPAGRGHEVTKSPVQLCAESHGISVRTPVTLKDDAELAFFKAQKIDAAVVVAYGLLLPQDYLAVPHYGCLNIHTSLLPRWRGSSPIHRALLEGDGQTGVTIMRMDEGMDTGPILLQKALPITESDTLETLNASLSTMGASLMLEALAKIKTLKPNPQPLEGVTHAPKLTKVDGMLDFSASVFALQRKVRGLNPWPGTTFIYKGEVIKVLKVEALQCMHDFKPGTVIDNALTVACGNGVLRLLEVQRAGKKAMAAVDFLKGLPIMPGECLA